MKLILGILALVILLGIWAWVYLQHDKFGPSRNAIRTDRVLASPNFVDGAFQNLVPTPVFREELSIEQMIIRNLTEKPPKDVTPTAQLPSVKVELSELAPGKDIVIWLGHSSFFVQLAGRRILIDPVFSPNAAPVPFANRAFEGATPYNAADIPEIDYLLITHEHWDHLDYDTLTALRPKVRNSLVALGLAPYFELWGYPTDRIYELDWNDSLSFDNLTIHSLPARHYSRRLFSSNQTLWVAFALVTENRKLFFSGDSGYGPHFADIGYRFGGFDMAALDTGQYNPIWPYIHMTPEETAQAADDLEAGALMPIHVGKYALSNHPWKEPFARISKISQDRAYRLVIPLIGAPIDFDEPNQEFPNWWEGLQQ